MTLPASGPISIKDIAKELGISEIGLSLGDIRVRTLLGHPSGPVYMSSAYGKSSGWRGTMTIGLLTSNLEDNVGYNPLTGTGAVSGGGTVNNIDVTPNSVRMQWTKSRNSYLFVTRFGLGTSLSIPVKITFGGERVYKLGSSKVSIVVTADDYNWFRSRVGQTISMTIEEDK